MNPIQLWLQQKTNNKEKMSKPKTKIEYYVAKKYVKIFLYMFFFSVCDFLVLSLCYSAKKNAALYLSLFFFCRSIIYLHLFSPSTHLFFFLLNFSFSLSIMICNIESKKKLIKLCHLELWLWIKKKKKKTFKIKSHHTKVIEINLYLG